MKENLLHYMFLEKIHSFCSKLRMENLLTILTNFWSATSPLPGIKIISFHRPIEIKACTANAIIITHAMINNMKYSITLTYSIALSRMTHQYHVIYHIYINRFQLNLSSNLPLWINYSHSPLQLSLFQRFLSLQTLVSNLHLHTHVSCQGT